MKITKFKLAHSSYDWIGDQIASALREEGVSLFESTPGEPSDLAIGPLDWVCAQPASAVYTMHESSQLSPYCVSMLNRKVKVIVPSAWCASVFSANGVCCQIAVVPLGHELEKEVHVPLKTLPVKFGVISPKWKVSDRKSVGEIVAAWKMADLPSITPAVLEICSYLPASMASDSIRVLPRFYGREELIGWMKTCHFAIAASKGEGFGLPQLEFSALGKPVVGPRHGSVAEFLPSCEGLSSSYYADKADDGYYRGIWMRPEIASLAKAMRMAVFNWEKLQENGPCIQNQVRQYTWRNTAKHLLQWL